MSRTKDYYMDYCEHMYGGDCADDCLFCARERAARHEQEDDQGCDVKKEHQKPGRST